MSGEITDHGQKDFAVLKAPRCQFTKSDGAGCGSPALKNRPFCYFHSRTPDGRKRNRSDKAKSGYCDVPVLNDDNAIRVAVTNVCRSLANKKLDSSRASTLLYGLQIASSSLRGRRAAAENEDRNHNMY